MAEAVEGGSKTDGGEQSSTADVEQLVAAAVEAATGALKAQVHRLSEENGRHRNRAKDEAATAAKALEEQGQFKALAEQRKADLEARDTRLAELEALVPVAERWRKHEEGLLATAKARREKLPPTWQELLDAQGDADGKAKVLRTYDSVIADAKGGDPLHKPPADGPPAGKNGDVDFDGAESESALRRLKAAHPKEWAAYKQAQTGGRQVGSSLSALF